MGYIDTIMDLGDDALQNLFEVVISPIQFLNDTSKISFRVVNFTIPSVGVTPYTVHYKTQSVTKPGGKIEVTPEFTLNYRIDRNWTVHKGLVAWKNAIANTATGVIGPDVYRVPISVYALDSDGQEIAGLGQWTFTGCWPSRINDVSFDYQSGEAIMGNVTFNFKYLDDTGL